MIALAAATSTDVPLSSGEWAFIQFAIYFGVGLLLTLALRSVITDAIKRSRKEGP